MCGSLKPQILYIVPIFCSSWMYSHHCYFNLLCCSTILFGECLSINCCFSSYTCTDCKLRPLILGPSTCEEKNKSDYKSPGYKPLHLKALLKPLMKMYESTTVAAVYSIIYLSVKYFNFIITLTDLANIDKY